MCVKKTQPSVQPGPQVLPVLCVAGVGRSLVGVAGGATKAAVAQHQARGRNMADLAAKDGSQETLVKYSLGECEVHVQLNVVQYAIH